MTSADFVSQTITDVEVRPAAHANLRFDLHPVSVFLNEVIVTPSHFRLLDSEPGDLSIKLYAPGVGLVVDDVTELVEYSDPGDP